MAKPPPASTPSIAPPAPAKLVIAFGRGSHGKTLLTRWMVERALKNHRKIVIADADRTNPTLSAFFAGVISPPSADDRDVAEWFEQLANQIVEDEVKAAFVIDFGGGDQVLKNLAVEMGLVEMLETRGVEVVALHLLGPDLDDLAYLRDLESGAFKPKRTVLVLNEALVPAHRTTASAFGALHDHPILISAVKRGAEMVVMPVLKCAAEIGRRKLTFDAAANGAVGLKTVHGMKEATVPPEKIENIDPNGPDQEQIGKPMSVSERQRIMMWLRAMDAAFEKVEDFLP